MVEQRVLLPKRLRVISKELKDRDKRTEKAFASKSDLKKKLRLSEGRLGKGRKF